MAEKIKIALAQLNIVWENKEANRRHCRQLVARAAVKKADLIVFPEMTLIGFSMDVADIAEAENSSPSIKFFQDLAKKYHLAIMFGLSVKSGKKGKNAAILINVQGKIISKYYKLHPFSYAKEDKFYQGGSKVSVVSLNGFKIMPIICYDLRFVGLTKAMVKYKPDVMIVIANWPKERKKQWQTLLSARALDLQAHVVGVNRRGRGDGLNYSGNSMAVSADGTIILKMQSQELGFVELTKESLTTWRKKFPFLTDSRDKLYSQL